MIKIYSNSEQTRVS